MCDTPLLGMGSTEAKIWEFCSGFDSSFSLDCSTQRAFFLELSAIFSFFLATNLETLSKSLSCVTHIPQTHIHCVLLFSVLLLFPLFLAMNLATLSKSLSSVTQTQQSYIHFFSVFLSPILFPFSGYESSHSLKVSFQSHTYTTNTYVTFFVVFLSPIVFFLFWLHI